MPNTEPVNITSAPAAPTPVSPPFKAATQDGPILTLDEFCDRRIEGGDNIQLISGFRSIHKGLGIARNTDAEFSGLLVTFANAPA